jgi:hypothetical protein
MRSTRREEGRMRRKRATEEAEKRGSLVKALFDETRQ